LFVVVWLPRRHRHNSSQELSARPAVSSSLLRSICTLQPGNQSPVRSKTRPQSLTKSSTVKSEQTRVEPNIEASLIPANSREGRCEGEDRKGQEGNERDWIYGGGVPLGSAGVETSCLFCSINNAHDHGTIGIWGAGTKLASTGGGGAAAEIRVPVLRVWHTSAGRTPCGWIFPASERINWFPFQSKCSNPSAKKYIYMLKSTVVIEKRSGLHEGSSHQAWRGPPSRGIE
jgi:hypothetical protein